MKMKGRVLRFFLFCSLIAGISSCIGGPEVPEFPEGEVEGLKPIYASVNEVKQIKVFPPRELKSPGKIVIYNDFILINEIGIGVHVVNNINPAEPIFIGFISIPGNTDVAVRDNYLYANNVEDLVTLDVNNFEDVKVVNRNENVFPPFSNIPFERGVYFECADEKKGKVIGWEPAVLMSPKCYR
jgi:hypothetical protein